MRRHTVTIVSLGLLIVSPVLWQVGNAAESQQTESKQTEPSKGLTVEDLTRGVRSAAQNIEKEIPKIGAAVGKTIKSIGSNSSEKKQDQPQATGKR